MAKLIVENTYSGGFLICVTFIFTPSSSNWASYFIVENIVCYFWSFGMIVNHYEPFPPLNVNSVSV